MYKMPEERIFQKGGYKQSQVTTTLLVRAIPLTYKNKQVMKLIIIIIGIIDSVIGTVAAVII